MTTFEIIIAGACAAVVLLVIHDLVQKRHAVIRNFPVIGHLRYMLEAIGPELRQYIVTSNNEERPFSRDERRWVYSSAKLQNDMFGFGTDNDLDSHAGHLIIRHAAFPYKEVDNEMGMSPEWKVPCAKVLGELHGRDQAFRPASIVNVSGMSFGALSRTAIEALNRGCAIAGALHTTGEGGLSDYHRHGGELVFQIGTGYFGCRTPDGSFSLEQLQETVGNSPVRAIEIKLSQGAKPGHGGILPAAKVSAEIARIRRVEQGRDCISPGGHSQFHDVDTLLEFVEHVADATGLPVGIKSAIGDEAFWNQLARRMAVTGTGPDFITVDGGEGGTGAAPLVLADHMSLPFMIGMPVVYRAFAREGLAGGVVFIGSGRLGLPDRAAMAIALGCDLINVGREAMLSIGCIQAQRCHTGHCPTGVATQNEWLLRGLDPQLKSVRCANYLIKLRRELAEIARICGAPHPACIDPMRFDLLDGQGSSESLVVREAYDQSWHEQSAAARASVEVLMTADHSRSEA